MEDYEKFNSFLLEIDLLSLREQYKNIKIVELDMPKDVQALECIYQKYWDKSEKIGLVIKRFMKSTKSHFLIN